MASAAFIAALAALMSAQPPLDCTNVDLVEVQCSAGGCATAENATPLTLSLGADGVTACAYSGCFSPTEGRISEGPHLIWSGKVARDSDLGDIRDLTLVVDRAEGVGMLRWGAFATPVRCSAR